MIFLLKYWRYVAGAALLAVIALAIHHYAHTRYVAGKAEIKALWTKDTEARDAATAVAIASARKREDDTRKHNDEVVADYAQKLSAAAGSRDEYFSLLQRARNQVRSLAASQADSAPGTVAASPTPSPEQLDAALAAALVESRENADQLDSVIAVVRTQM